jgi:hypothetical protein
VLLTLGSRTFDVTGRALVVGVLATAGTPVTTVCRDAERLVDEGADLLELAGDDAAEVRAAIEALSTAVAVPLGVASSQASVAAAAVAGGGVFAAGVTLAPALEAGSAHAFVAMTFEQAAAAASNRGPDRVVLDLTPRLRPRPAELGLGCALLTSTCPARPGSQDDRATVLASAALAISTGCHLVRTRDVRAVARVRDVLAAVIGEHVGDDIGDQVRKGAGPA